MKAFELQPTPDAVRNGPWVKECAQRVVSGVQVIETVGTETGMMLDAAREVSRAIKYPMLVWDCAAGFTLYGDDKAATAIGGAIEKYAKAKEDAGPDGDGPFILNPINAISLPVDLIVPSHPSFYIVYLNFYRWFQEEVVRQVLESAVIRNRLNCMQTVGDKPIHLRRIIHFIQSPYARLNGVDGVEAVKHLFRPIPFPLPSEQELLDVNVAAAVKQVESLGSKFVQNNDPAYLRSIAASCRGLERAQATTVIFNAVATHRGLTADVPIMCRRETAAHIAETSKSLRIVDEDEIPPPESVCGVANVIQTLTEAASAFTEAGKAQHLDPARGIYFAGLPRSGKSTTARMAAGVFRKVTGRVWTTVQIRAGYLYEGLVGATEHNWRDVETKLDTFGEDLIVWLDELDKVFNEKNEDSSGVTTSLLGLLLTWLENPKRKPYVIFSMNSLEGIPSTLIGDGRVNCGFFFDFPTPEVRRATLEVHFAKRLKLNGWDLGSLKFTENQWDELIALTEQWLPGELEQLVVESRTKAFLAHGTSLPTYDQVRKVAEIKKRSVTAVQKKGELDRLRQSCANARRIDVDASVSEATTMIATTGTPMIMDLDPGRN